MSSRYANSPHIDFCYSPVHVKKDGKDLYVPCGKCDGCLLHHANLWSQRIGNEIESSVASIFGTLTYDNFYLPTLVPILNNDGSVNSYISDHSNNIRFNSVRNVLRDDHIIINYPYDSISIQNDDRKGVLNYASKRDIQLWLKLLRKDLELHFYGKYDKGNFLRYYVISEYGPTTFRGHFHFTLHFQSAEIAAYLLEDSLYKNWKMCDESLFKQYTHYCDSGCRGYVTNYVTGKSDLPRVYRENKKIAPFRLSSKSPAIGYICFDIRKIFEDVSVGIIEYDKQISRLGEKSILRYPKDFMCSLFPKCEGFSFLSFERILIIYGYLFRSVEQYGGLFTTCSKRCSETFGSNTFAAMYKCYIFCRDYGLNPFHYCYLLDMYYYKSDMFALKMWYSQMETVDFKNHPLDIVIYYSNIHELLMSKYSSIVVDYFFSFMGLSSFDISNNRDLVLFIKHKRDAFMDNYKKEVSDILSNMVKMPKYNELSGLAPHIV